MKAILPRAGLFLCILCPLLALPTAGAACTQTQAGITVDLQVHKDTTRSDEQFTYTWGITFSAEEDYIMDVFFQHALGADVSKEGGVMPADSDWFFYPGTFLFLPPFDFLRGVRFEWMEAGTPLQQDRQFEFSYTAGLQDPLRVYVTSFDGAIFDATFEPGLCCCMPPQPPDDTTAPECLAISIEKIGGKLSAVQTGATDPESGIASVRFTRLQNLEGFADGTGGYTQGDLASFDAQQTSSVTIRGERIDMSKGGAIVTEVTNGAGLTAMCDPVVSSLSAEVPEAFGLAQNYPNPFNPSTQISFRLTESAPVRLRVYDVTGRVVVTLVNEQLHAGTYEAVWDGQDAQGRLVPSGVYLYRLEAGRFSETRQMTLLK